MADEPEVTLETVAAGLVELSERIAGLPTNEQLGELKSGLQSNYDKLRTDVDSLSSSSNSATELGRAKEGIESRRTAEQQQEALSQERKSRDDYWAAITTAVYEKNLPKEMFDGVSSASEVKRLTAMADWVGAGKTNETNEDGKKKQSSNAGPGGDPPNPNAGKTPIAIIGDALKS